MLTTAECAAATKDSRRNRQGGRGWPKIRYNASALASGVYFYRITAEGQERDGRFTSVGKMLLLK